MKLERLPRFRLAEFPTPIHHLETLSKAYNGPEIYMKRDDLTSLGMGGNKTRKLEFLIGEALEQGKDTLVTAGGLQSNHCRLTAAAARKAGFKCHLILNGTKPSEISVSTPDAIYFRYNAKTAERLNRTIPPELVAIAKEVYR